MEKIISSPHYPFVKVACMVNNNKKVIYPWWKNSSKHFGTHPFGCMRIDERHNPWRN